LDLIRVGVIGLGKMGLLHTCILNVLSNVQIIALCDRSSLIRKFSKRLFNNVHVVKDIEGLYRLDLDVVYVTTPIFSHSFLAKKIYLNGIARNLFVEKTLASSYDEAKELCDLAQSYGGINMVGYMKRFAVTFNEAKNLLVKGKLGEVISFKGYAYSSDFVGAKKSSKVPAVRGIALRDLGSHALDLALWFFGDFQVESAMPQLLNENDPEPSVYFRVTKPANGLIGEFNVSRCMKSYRLPEIGLLIEGSEGSMNVNEDRVELKLNDKQLSTWYRHDLNDNAGFMLGAPEYFRENEYFVKSISEGRNVEPSFYTASKVDQLIDQVIDRVEENV
jgi:predicted dehydrogenase